MTAKAISIPVTIAILMAYAIFITPPFVLVLKSLFSATLTRASETSYGFGETMTNPKIKFPENAQVLIDAKVLIFKL